MKTIFILKLSALIICSISCRPLSKNQANESIKTENSSYIDTLPFPKTIIKNKSGEYGQSKSSLHHKAHTISGKNGCVPNHSLNINDKGEFTALSSTDGSSKSMIIFDTLFFHPKGLNSYDSSYAPGLLYVHDTLLARWNALYKAAPDKSLIEIGICDYEMSISGYPGLTVSFATEGGFLENKVQKHPSKSQHDCEKK